MTNTEEQMIQFSQFIAAVTSRRGYLKRTRIHLHLLTTFS
jgi:hypothetical protein